MRNISGVVVFCFCLMTVGCNTNPKLNEERDKKVVEALKADKSMLVPNWYRAAFNYTDTDAWGQSRIYNSLFQKMGGLHLLLLVVASCVAGRAVVGKAAEKITKGLAVFGIGTLGVFALWVVVWLVSSIVIPIFSSGSYIPFSFVGFLLMVGVWVAAISVWAAVFISRSAGIMLSGKVAWGRGGSEPASTNVMGVKVPAPTRRGRILRAMMKAGFVAVASAIGAKVGGWVGGVLVFVISAGVSAYFELPADGDHLDLHEPPSQLHP